MIFGSSNTTINFSDDDILRFEFEYDGGVFEVFWRLDMANREFKWAEGDMADNMKSIEGIAKAIRAAGGELRPS